MVVAEANTEGDELVVADIDLDECKRGKGKVFTFERHRRPEYSARIVEQTGVVEPPLL
jgi:predicted amidohydrolase